MEKLLALSKDIDDIELYPAVQQVGKLSQSQADLAQVHASLSEAKQKTKRVELVNFFAALVEGVGVFNDFSSLELSVRKEIVQSCRDSAQFYLNRILKDAKERDEQNKTEWAKELSAFLQTCSGLSGPKADLSQKIEKMAIAPVSCEQTKPQPNVPRTAPAAKPAKIELVGNVWYIDNQMDQEAIEVEVKEMQQRIAISNCQRSVIKIRGKCTAVSVEGGMRLGVVVDGVIVSTFELLNSAQTQVQLNSACPTMTVDNCEGIQVFLGTGVHERFELFTCKSNEINVYKQTHADPCEFSNEIPIPEQFKSFFDAESGNLVTEPVKHTAV